MSPDLPNAPVLPENYPSQWVEAARLNDETLVTVRPIRPDDGPRLQAAFRRLSGQSVYLRFLQTFKELSDQQAYDFSHLDYQSQMALVAEVEEAGATNLIGVARYARSIPEEPDVAEAAIVVVDEYQKRGLGSLLLDRLTRYARSHGVKFFLATVHQTNAPILRLIQRTNFQSHKKMLEPGVWEVRVDLERRISARS